MVDGRLQVHAANSASSTTWRWLRQEALAQQWRHLGSVSPLKIYSSDATHRNKIRHILAEPELSFRGTAALPRIVQLLSVSTAAFDPFFVARPITKMRHRGRC